MAIFRQASDKPAVRCRKIAGKSATSDKISLGGKGLQFVGKSEAASIGSEKRMDLNAIFGTGDVQRMVVEAMPKTPADGLFVGWSEWTEERDGRTWRVIQKDGETVVPWEEGVPWE